MSKFYLGMNELKKLEFSSPWDVLHHNAGEEGYTYYGIYQKPHPTWVGWEKVYKMIGLEKNLKRASKKLYHDKLLEKDVYEFYKKEFWDIKSLSLIDSQKIANEIFIFSVNTNPKKAIKKAQKLVGVKVDGWVGLETLTALNAFDEDLFDIMFDDMEIAYYKYLAFFSPNRKRLKRFYNGWVNRARAV